jgi:hypothetical protein
MLVVVLGVGCRSVTGRRYSFLFRNQSSSMAFRLEMLFSGYRPFLKYACTTPAHILFRFFRRLRIQPLLMTHRLAMRIDTG